MSSRCVHLRLPQAQVDQIEAAARAAGVERNTWVVSAIRTVVSNPPKMTEMAPPPRIPLNGSIPTRIPNDLLLDVDRVRGPAARSSWIRWATQRVLSAPARKQEQ